MTLNTDDNKISLLSTAATFPVPLLPAKMMRVNTSPRQKSEVECKQSTTAVQIVASPP